MRKNYNQIFQEISKVDISEKIEVNIINKIHKLERNRLFAKQIAYSSISILSLIGIVYSGIYALNELASSGIYEYFYLIITDIEILNYWKELTYSIAESLPLFGITICLTVFAIFLWSISKTSKIQIFKNALA